MEFLKPSSSISVETGKLIERKPHALSEQVTQASIDFNGLTPQMQKAVLALTQREFASSIENDGIRHDIDQNGVVLNPTQLNTRLGNATLDALYTNTIPKTKERRIERTYEWAEKDDLVSSFLDIKNNLAILGFDLRCKEEEGSGEDFQETPKTVDPLSTGNSTPELSPEEKANLKEQVTFQKYLSRLHRKWDLTAVVSDLLYDWFVSDSCILYWHVDVPNPVGSPPPEVPPAAVSSEQEEEKYELLPGVNDICALSPKDCSWVNDYGQDILLYRIPLTIKMMILELRKITMPSELAKAKALLVSTENIPLRWIDAVLGGSDRIPLRNADGDYWMIRTKRRRREGLSDPSMATIFLWLEMRKTLKEGDFAVSFVMKHFILHVKMGESISSGLLAGLKNNWPTQDETDAMQTVVATATKTMRLVTNHTVQFEFIFPPKEMFDEIKYQKPEKCILNWGGLTSVLMTGDGATNSSGYIGTKRVVANIKVARQQVSYLLTEFFDHPTIESKLTTKLPEESMVAAVFDENGLKEARQLLDELKFGLSEGFIDPSTAQKELGRDGDSIRMSKLRALEDNKRTGVFQPMNPKNNQQVNQDRAGVGGRPANAGTVKDNDTLNQPATLK